VSVNHTKKEKLTRKTGLKQFFEINAHVELNNIVGFEFCPFSRTVLILLRLLTFNFLALLSGITSGRE
jgi:hypothetical protein